MTSRLSVSFTSYNLHKLSNNLKESLLCQSGGSEVQIENHLPVCLCVPVQYPASLARSLTSTIRHFFRAVSPSLPELYINIKKSSSSRSCRWRRQAISGRVRARSDWDQHSNSWCCFSKIPWCVVFRGLCLGSGRKSCYLAKVSENAPIIQQWGEEKRESWLQWQVTSSLNQIKTSSIHDSLKLLHFTEINQWSHTRSSSVKRFDFSL